MTMPVELAKRLTHGPAHDEAAGVPVPAAFARRLAAARWALLAAAAMLAGAAILGELPVWQAIVVWAVAAGTIGLAPDRTGGPAGAPRHTPKDSDTPSIEAFMTAAPNPLILLDDQLFVRFFNASARELLPNLRIGETIAFAMRVPTVMDAIRGVAEAGGTRLADYSERVPVERSVEAQIAAIPDEAGRAAFILVVLRDVTQQRRVDQMRADFVANASHELRTPLASLLGFVETLQGPARNDAVAREKFLGIMRAQATRMSRLIDDLLSLSRIELNAHVRPAQPVDLGHVVSHVADTLAPLAQERGVELHVTRDPAALVVQGERDELIRVVENLVENAIKYGAGGKRVDITLAAARRTDGRCGEAVVTVRDYGPGIPAEHLPRLTERFYRVDVAQSRDKGGTGLGLAIVKHIIARHRGRLVIESEAGQGASFTVRLNLQS